MLECVRCSHLGAGNNPTFTDCVCPPGTYLPMWNDTSENYTASGTIPCLKCPEGADCARKGVSRESLATQGGFWRTSTESLTFYRCLAPQDVPFQHRTCPQLLV